MFNHRRRRVSGIASAAALIIVAGGVAAPDAVAQNPYPDIDQYHDAGSLEKFKLYAAEGIWFTTPLGLYCGIGEDSSFGCAGKLPGAPAGENEVAWFPGDPFPRLYQSDQPRFNSGLNQQLLTAYTVLSYRGIKCAITMESGVYCISRDDLNSQIMITSGMTYRGADGLPAG